MNIEETERLIAAMRQHGVTHYKSRDVEIQMDSYAHKYAEEPHRDASPLKLKSKASKIPPQAAPPVESTIPHHVNEVANLLKLGDEDLVDKLFPDYSQLEAKE